MFGLMKVMNHQLHDLAMVKSHSRREREREQENCGQFDEKLPSRQCTKLDCHHQYQLSKAQFSRLE